MSQHNEDLALALDEMADLLALKDENPFRIRAYRRAAQTVRATGKELAREIAAGFDPDAMPGIGKDLARKFQIFFRTGQLPGLAAMRREVPSGLRDLMSLPNVGPKRARALHTGLNIRNRDDLRKAATARRVRELAGFGPRLESQLLRQMTAGGTPTRVLRRVAADYAESLRAWFSKRPGVERATIAGSLRRGRETIGDIDLVLSCERPIDLGKALSAYEETSVLIASGATKASALLKCGLQVDVRAVRSGSYGAALYYFTGSKAHNIRVRRLAQRRGLKINEYGVFRGSNRVAGESEESVLKSVGLPFIEPELREDRGEIEAGQNDGLPTLVVRSDLRGDLHVHTKASDGHDTLPTLIEAARRQGLEYLAVTDHSQHLGVVHGLDRSALAGQADDIDRLNASLHDFTLLKGVEVDILADGKLALPDSVLATMDIVIVALHDRFALSRRKQTERILRAMDNPFVSILAHPSARLINERPAIRCDWAEVFRHAERRPLYLELNAQPSRLDLDELMVREAAAHGVLVSIGSDAHGENDFRYLEDGITQARRGWLAKSDVLNTRPLNQLLPLLRKTFLGHKQAA